MAIRWSPRQPGHRLRRQHRGAVRTAAGSRSSSTTSASSSGCPGSVDVVMHFASPASPVDFERIPIQILKVGGLGTHNSLGLAKAKGARFFLASTSEVYGDPQVHPQPETLLGPRQPDRPARRVRRGQALRRGDDDGVPPPPRPRRADRADLQLDPRRRAGALRRRGRAAAGDASASSRRGSRRHRISTGTTVPAFDADGQDRRRRHGRARRPSDVRRRASRSAPATAGRSASPAITACSSRDRDGRPVARTVGDLAIGDRVAIAGRIDGARARPCARVDARRLGRRRDETRGCCSCRGRDSVTWSGSADRSCSALLARARRLV